jgi:hypothetical protein
VEACYGGTDVMERSCAVARGIDINTSMAGHQRTADTPAGGGRADNPAGGGPGGRYNADGHACLRYGGRKDTERAPTRRKGGCSNISGVRN